jgi:alpha-tubulin suppressor-like RCC1 family protein
MPARLRRAVRTPLCAVPVGIGDGAGRIHRPVLLGDGGSGLRPSPVPIQPPAGVRYAVLASGGATSYALTTGGDVYAWGVNRAGEVGDGGTRTAVTPVRVDSGATVISSTAGNVVAASTAR